METPDLQSVYATETALLFQNAEGAAIMNEETSWYEDEMGIDFWYEGKRWGGVSRPRMYCVSYNGATTRFPTKHQAIGELARLRVMHSGAAIKSTQWVRRGK